MENNRRIWAGLMVVSLIVVIGLVAMMSSRYPYETVLEKMSLTENDIIYKAPVNNGIILFSQSKGVISWSILSSNMFGYKYETGGLADSLVDYSAHGYSLTMIHLDKPETHDILFGLVNNPNILEVSFTSESLGSQKVKGDAGFYYLDLKREYHDEAFRIELLGAEEQVISTCEKDANGIQVTTAHPTLVNIEQHASSFVNTDSLANMEEGIVYTIYVFATDYDLENRTITVDEVEWVNSPERASALGLNYDEDMPSGFFIYNGVDMTYDLPLDDKVHYTMLNETTPMDVDGNVVWEFIDYMKADGFSYPFTVKLLNGKVNEINQVYLP